MRPVMTAGPAVEIAGYTRDDLGLHGGRGQAGHPSVPLLNEQLRGSKIASLTGRQDLGFVADDHLRPDGVFVMAALAHRGPEMT